MKPIHRGLSPKLAALPPLDPPRLYHAWAQPMFDRIERAALAPIGSEFEALLMTLRASVVVTGDRCVEFTNDARSQAAGSCR